MPQPAPLGPPAPRTIVADATRTPTCFPSLLYRGRPALTSRPSPSRAADGKVVYEEYTPAKQQELLDAAKAESASADA